MPESPHRFLREIIGNNEPEDDAATKERQHAAQALALHVDYRDGLSSEGVSWSFFARYHWRDMGSHELLRILFGAVCALEITGHNLKALERDVRSGQLNGIKEMLTGQAKLEANGDKPVITGIKAYPDFDALFEALKAEGQEEEHDAGFARKVRGR